MYTPSHLLFLFACIYEFANHRKTSVQFQDFRLFLRNDHLGLQCIAPSVELSIPVMLIARLILILKSHQNLALVATLATIFIFTTIFFFFENNQNAIWNFFNFEPCL